MKNYLAQCKLCTNRAELRTSHIYPKFIIKIIKGFISKRTFITKKHLNGYAQDGFKLKLLCGKCEQYLGKLESWFSKKYYNKLQDENSINLDNNDFNDHLVKIMASIAWRALIYGYEVESKYKEIPGLNFDQYLNNLKDYFYHENKEPAVSIINYKPKILSAFLNSSESEKLFSYNEIVNKFNNLQEKNSSLSYQDKLKYLYLTSFFCSFKLIPNTGLIFILKIPSISITQTVYSLTGNDLNDITNSQIINMQLGSLNHLGKMI